MIKRILFPTDFLEGSKKAISMAVDLAKRYSAELHIVHVIYDIVKTTGLYIPHVAADELFKSLEEEAQKQIKKEYVEETRGLEKVHHMVLRGVPYKEIVRFAEEKEIDLIVIPSHARKGIERIIFGSTAEKVVKYAPCNVLTVRIVD